MSARLVARALGTATIAGVCAWLAPSPSHSSWHPPEPAVADPSAHHVGRRLEDLYAEATVVAQVVILDETKWGTSVRPLAVFKSDEKPIKYVEGPVVFCSATFAIGGVYVVFAERDPVRSDLVRVLDGRSADEIDTYMATAPGGRSARFIDRLEQLSGVAGFTGRPPRVAAGLPNASGCSTTSPTASTNGRSPTWQTAI